MKFLKNTSMLLLNSILVLTISILSFSAIWYILPEIHTTVIGTNILKIFSQKAIMWVTISTGILYLIGTILNIIFHKKMSSRFNNLFVHLRTWLILVITGGLTIATFLLVAKIDNAVVIGTLRKIYIVVDLIALFIFYTLAGKISKVINRRIQAYETAKEINTIGRGSIFWTNFLKLFEIFFPEVLVLLLVCFIAGWNVSTYFIIVLVASIIPMLGNIICDINIRHEILRKNKKEKDELAVKIANQIKEK